jgi:DUF1365 family protein
VSYALKHRVYYLALDLDELDAVDRGSWSLGRNRRAVHAFYDRDHWSPPADDLRGAVHAHLRELGHDPTRWRVTLVASPRFLGYQFNPASFYLCHDVGGALRVVVVEVHNTHGERHLYTLRPEASGTGHRATMDKTFYVSPFIGMDARYVVRVHDTPGRLAIAISETEAGRATLTATLVLRRMALTDRGLARLALTMPFSTHRTIASIHLHAWRLWRLGLPFHRHARHAP